MGISDWFKRARRDTPITTWRQTWERAVAARDAAAAADLRTMLTADPPLADDVEVEQEMLDALDRLIALAAELDAGLVPRVETTHRVVGADTCHFTAPASMPDDAAQASGRVLLTSSRAVFFGGAKLAAMPWHAVRDVAAADRDLLLIRSTDDARRFRFNTYTDALEAAALARHLKR